MQKNLEQAVYWHRQSAQQGNRVAQSNLGYCYERGIGILKDEREAVYWYQEAAQQGDAMGKMNLGRCYLQGIGTEQNEELAARFFLEAAEQGNAAAQSCLGECYEFGRGITQDYAEAMRWYQKAVQQKYTGAQKKLARCYHKANPEDSGVQEEESFYEVTGIRENPGAELCLNFHIRQKTVGFGRKVLIKDIAARFEGGDFVLILGSAGAGKTTLIKAILGESKAEGTVLLNEQDLYKNFKRLKSQIGIVPQFSTLRSNDTVRATLMDSARLKLGSHHSRAELETRVEEVLKQVGLQKHADKLISQLSGGQLKKASVANLLVGSQRVFVCDEPDSGLDAASRVQQMNILKDISEEQNIVMVISHMANDAVDEKGNILFTKVLVIARSNEDQAGHMAFYGTPQKALQYFHVEKLQDIMQKINPQEEGGTGEADVFIRRFDQLRKGRK